jgi:hypothetical protein
MYGQWIGVDFAFCWYTVSFLHFGGLIMDYHDDTVDFDYDHDDYYDDSMDGDHDSAMTSCGWGTDEDYGYFGDDTPMFDDYYGGESDY